MEASRQASSLLNGLREQASRRGWKQTSKCRMSIDEVWMAFHRVPAVNPDGEYERLVLNKLLDEMEQNGGIARLRTHDREKIPLPAAIWLLPTRTAVAATAPMPPWHPSLRTFASYWPTATARQRAAYTAINLWLMAGPDRTPIPIRERALEIFGRYGAASDFPMPEKTFDTLRSGPLFSDSDALHRLISAFVVHPPLLAEQFTEAVGDGYLQRVGSGRRLLVIENATTWWSVVKSLPEKHALGYVAWGLGNTFVSSINTIAQRHQVSEIRYFGDLDLSGLRIPNSAARTAAEKNLPMVRPATALYRALLQRGKAIVAKEKAITYDAARELTRWLETDQHQVAAILTRGQRIAQEWVGFRHLSQNDEWHRDVL